MGSISITVFCEIKERNSIISFLFQPPSQIPNKQEQNQDSLVLFHCHRSTFLSIPIFYVNLAVNYIGTGYYLGHFSTKIIWLQLPLLLATQLFFLSTGTACFSYEGVRMQLLCFHHILCEKGRSSTITTVQCFFFTSLVIAQLTLGTASSGSCSIVWMVF